LPLHLHPVKKGLVASMKKMPFRILPAAVCLAVLCSGCGSVNSFVLSTAPTAYDRTYTDPASGSAMD
jgi:hypothetical protein